MPIARRRLALLPAALVSAAGFPAVPALAATAPEGALLSLVLSRSDESPTDRAQLWVPFGQPSVLAVDGLRIDLTVHDRGDLAEVSWSVRDLRTGTPGLPGRPVALRLAWERGARVALMPRQGPETVVDIVVRRMARPA